MEYEQKPGNITIFKNQKKKDSHPDYSGQGLDLEGNKVRIACWVKTSKSGSKFMSCQISPPFEKLEDQKPAAEDPNDDIPF